MRDLEECLGESHHKIQRWIGNGWLRDTMQGTRRHDGNGRDIHRFREQDLLDFIRKHLLEINLGRLHAIWFLDMILLKGREASEGRSRHGTEVDGEAAEELRPLTHPTSASPSKRNLGEQSHGYQ